MTVQQQHFVDFFSPGTFFSEQSRKPIDAWDINLAVALSNDVLERHDAKPYGFQFVTCIVADPISDGEGGTLDVKPKEVERSDTHFIGGTVLRYDEILDEEYRILRTNMQCNGWPVCIENCNSWRFTGAFNDDDVIVDEKGVIVRRGNDPDLLEYRNRQRIEWEKQ